MNSCREWQLTAILSSLYFMVEVGRQQAAKGEKDTIRQAFGMRQGGMLLCIIANEFLPVILHPHILHYLTNLVAKLRWDDAYYLPITKVGRSCYITFAHN